MPTGDRLRTAGRSPRCRCRRGWGTCWCARARRGWRAPPPKSRCCSASAGWAGATPIWSCGCGAGAANAGSARRAVGGWPSAGRSFSLSPPGRGSGRGALKSRSAWRSPFPIASPGRAMPRARPGHRRAGEGSSSIPPRRSPVPNGWQSPRRRAWRRARASSRPRRSTRPASRRCSRTGSRRGAACASIQRPAGSRHCASAGSGRSASPRAPTPMPTRPRSRRRCSMPCARTGSTRCPGPRLPARFASVRATPSSKRFPTKPCSPISATGSRRCSRASAGSMRSLPKR